MKAIKKISQASGEQKTIEDNKTSSSFVSSSAFTHSSNDVAPAQGDGEAQRVGDKIRVKDYSWRALIDAGTTQGIVRLLIIQQLADTLNSFSTSISCHSFLPDMNITNGRYKVIEDRLFYVGGDKQNSMVLKRHISAKKLALKSMEFDEGAATYIGNGKLHIFLFTNNATASQLTVDSNLKLRYYDA